MKLPFLSEEESWALTLTTFAGLSTSVGAVFAVIKQPDDALLAFLLGNAIGVMVLLSVAEMWIHNALSHGWLEITVAFGLGALLYHFCQPYIPDFGSHHHELDQKNHKASDFEKMFAGDDKLLMPTTSQGGRAVERQDSAGSQPERRRSTAAAATADMLADGNGGSRQALPRPSSSGGLDSNGSDGGGMAGPSATSRGLPPRLRPRQLLRLGLLMAVTMTLHNLPEGFAVAFASFTDFGPVMAAAIALHNIPEGVIVAAPMYAATGSRWKALGLATASGLSEPVGALLALLLVKPFLTEARLHYILGFVGGLMAAVSVLELWPVAKRCRHDRRMYYGMALGIVCMGGTLFYV
ncbi:hypothetical protein D9Q98_007945 [Chlorella vulgaris]|uniref:Uncharacterized protein n=1 Tax=Chlorella vulgaris TaxID=3077 RepID=A0A9D4THW2_CHLVU|nr:hypothetical protein D9Q98_007945 [Chlorella vulgaris]